MSEPTLIASVDREASLSNGHKQGEARGGAVRIDCTPKALGDKDVTLALKLLINPRISDAKPADEPASGTGIATFEAETEMLVPFGQTLIICGAPKGDAENAPEGILVLVTADAVRPSAR